MIKKIIFIIIIFYIGYLRGYGESPVREIEKINDVIQNNTYYISNETVCVDYKTYNITRERIIYNLKNRTIDLTKSQERQIMNLKARKCNTDGCAYGYYLCKEDALTLLELPHPKFSEKPPTGYDPLFKQIEYIPVKTDSNGKYIELSLKNWVITNTYYVFDKARICRDIQISNETLWTAPLNSTELFLREVWR